MQRPKDEDKVGMVQKWRVDPCFLNMVEDDDMKGIWAKLGRASSTRVKSLD